MNLIKYLAVSSLILFVVSCKKDPIINPDLGEKYENGLLVLCEGLFHQNNSSLTWINLTTGEVEKDVFQKVNNRLLGDIGNDMLLYGSKIYITVTTSSTVEVLDKNTLKSIKQIPFDYNQKAQQPRYLASHNGKVFVSSFDGFVSVLDTASLKIEKRIKVGRNPEGICVSDHSLYVANSGGLDFENMDTTVMAIDLNTLKVTDTFVVGQNPGRMIADDFGNIYVVKQGDFGTNPSELVRINTFDKSVVNLHIPATSLSKRENHLYLSYYSFEKGASDVSIFDCANQTLVSSQFINSQSVTTLFNTFPFQKDKLICLDAMNYTNSGYLRFFDSSGGLINSINVGLNPNTIIHF